MNFKKTKKNKTLGAMKVIKKSNVLAWSGISIRFDWTILIIAMLILLIVFSFMAWNLFVNIDRSTVFDNASEASENSNKAIDAAAIERVTTRFKNKKLQFNALNIEEKTDSTSYDTKQENIDLISEIENHEETMPPVEDQNFDAEE